jgi:hypothetical protein
MNLNLGSEGWSSLFRGTLVAGLGAALTYLTANVGGVDFGSLPKEVVVAGMSVLVNYVRKALNIF